MDGGITPKSQPLDVLINKIFKGFFRDLFEEWSLQAPMQDNGHPYAPSRQLLAQWIVEAWKKIPEDLVKKAWAVCQYRAVGELEKEVASEAIVEYSKENLGSFVEKIVGEAGINAWIDDANDPEVDPEKGFPEVEGELWELASDSDDDDDEVIIADESEEEIELDSDSD